MPYLQQQQAAPDPNVSATDLATQIRAQVNAQLKQAGLSDQIARSAANGAAQGVTGVTISKNGKVITVKTPGAAPPVPQAPAAPVLEETPTAPVASSSTSVPEDSPFDVPPRVENLGYALLLMIAVIAVGKPLARAFGSIIERRALKQPMAPEIGSRLERIEQGIEAVSIEIERISESQRYLLKVQVPAPERVELPRSAS